MTQFRAVPEYSLEEKSARTYPQWDHSRVLNQTWLGQEGVRLRQLYAVCTMLVDISERIRDSVRELEQSQREQV